MLPHFSGRAIRVELQATLGPHWAATHIPRRLIQLDQDLLRTPGEFERILIHELFHFVWVRLGNPARRSWEEILKREILRGARGELGWSAEWRKRKLSASDVRARTLAWRYYACESFCDTAAWLYAGGRHPEFTLAQAARAQRKKWLEDQFDSGARC